LLDPGREQVYDLGDARRGADGRRSGADGADRGAGWVSWFRCYR